MEGITDSTLVRAAYELGLLHGRAGLVSDLRKVLEADPFEAQHSLRNDSARKLTRIGQLELSWRTVDLCASKDLVLVGQLAELTEDEVQYQKGFSKETITELREAMAKRHFSFKLPAAQTGG